MLMPVPTPMLMPVPTPMLMPMLMLLLPVYRGDRYLLPASMPVLPSSSFLYIEGTYAYASLLYGGGTVFFPGRMDASSMLPLPSCIYSGDTLFPCWCYAYASFFFLYR